MSVYNGETYLKESIESILNQTYKNFEFIIVDDHSSDNSLSTILSFDDSRIVVIRNTKNIGLAASLNKALKIAKGEYIARMDDDDISLPERIEKQIQFMDSHSSCGVLGTYAELFGSKTGFRKHASKSDELKIRTLFSCQFPHPTVLIRKKVLKDNKLEYNEQFSTAQDYELWSRMIKITEFNTLPEILLKYRTHEKQISVENRKKQLENTKKIHQKLLLEIGLKNSEESLTIHDFLTTFPHRMSLIQIKKTENHLSSIILANEKSNFINHHSLSIFLSEYFYNICKKSKINALIKCFIFSNSILSKNNQIKSKRIKILLSPFFNY